MANYDQRLKVLEQRTNNVNEWTALLDDETTDAELEQLQRTGKKYYRASDPRAQEMWL